MNTTLRPRIRRSALAPVLALALALGAGLTGCGEDTGPTGEGSQATASPTEESPTAEPDPVVVAVYEEVEFYGACGNEPLTHEVDGERISYYPLLMEEEGPDVTRYGSGMGVRFGAVAPPGPGDDVGTLTVYDDGYAHFVSDSGQEYWLHEEPRDYNWIC